MPERTTPSTVRPATDPHPARRAGVGASGGEPTAVRGGCPDRDPSPRRRPVAALAGLGCVLSVCVVAPAPSVGAAELEVGPGEAALRAALVTASGNGLDDDLVLTPGATYELTCAGGGELSHTDAAGLRIRGAGATIRQTCAGERVLSQQGAGLLTVEDVVITGGSSPGDGGGIEAAGSVVALRSHLVGNSNGAIDADGDITLVDTTVSGNHHGDGAIVTTQYGTASVANSTLTANTSVGSSILYGDDGVVLAHVTIAGNAGGESVGSFDTGGPETPGLEAIASVVTATDDGGPACDIDGPVLSAGWNLDGDGTCGFVTASDLPAGTPPGLGPLTHEIGPTPTMVPQAGSPLVDAVAPADCGAAFASGLVADQRGVARPQGGGCDIGAVEVIPVPGPGPGAGGGAPGVPGEPSNPPPTSAPRPPVVAAPRFTG